MSSLPRISGWEAVRAFKKVGYELVRDRNGHAILKKGGVPMLLSVPIHDELKSGTLRQLIRVAGITPDDFRKLL